MDAPVQQWRREEMRVHYLADKHAERERWIALARDAMEHVKKIGREVSEFLELNPEDEEVTP